MQNLLKRRRQQQSLVDTEPFCGTLPDETAPSPPVFATDHAAQKPAAVPVGSFEEEASFLEQMLEGRRNSAGPRCASEDGPQRLTSASAATTSRAAVSVAAAAACVCRTKVASALASCARACGGAG